ncbi:hypothetical protein BH10ACI2_BH10ACI2_02560 [soil metagenome]
MPEEEIINKGNSDDSTEADSGSPASVATRRRFLTRRKAFVTIGLLALAGVVVSIVSIALYKYGVLDTYVRAQFVAKMEEIGVVFDADVFRISVNPLEVELKNATFNDKISGEKLFFIRDAHLNLTVKDLYAWQLSRDISIDKTVVNGAEVWVKFDENGNSNFANLKFVEKPGGNVNFKYDSVDVSIQDSTAHFGDVSRKLGGNARNVSFLLSPQNRDVAEDQRRYNFDFKSTDSNFIYDTASIEKIDIHAIGIADPNGAEIKSFELKSPVAESTLSGTITDWKSPKYDLDIQSSVDLTQASSLLPGNTSLIGVGNFKGKVSGQGENYKITGDVDAASLRAGGVFLKALNVNATAAGTNTNYEANGKVIAEMLTFDVFRVDFLKMIGNVRGTGTDFRWVGELQAAAASTPNMSMGGLFLSDALAEYKDRQLRASSGNARARKFAIGDTEFADLAARNVKFGLDGDRINLTSPNLQARSLRSKDFSLNGISGTGATVKHSPYQTQIDIATARSESAEVKGNKAKNVSVDNFRFNDNPASTKVTGTNFRAGQLNIKGALIDGIEAPAVDVTNSAAGLVVYVDKMHVAKLDAGAATLGSLNIGGVRLTIKQGRVEARSGDIDAGNVALTKSTDLPAGGNLEAVKLYQPVFILEPSGRYRATADMSLGGGAIGSIALGSAKAKVDVNNDTVALNELTAEVLGGRLVGNAVIGTNDRTQSRLTGDFTDLDISKLIAMQGGSITPVDGKTTGNLDLTFNGTNFRSASGTLNAAINANAGTADRGTIPVTGEVKLTATNGLFNVDLAKLNTEKTGLTANGRFDLRDKNSDLTVALRSTDANEIDRLVRVLGISDDLVHQLDDLKVQLAGNLTFDGHVTGNLTDPTVDGRASLDSISMRGREVGSIATDILVASWNVELRNGKLRDRTGGTADFSASIPTTGTNNIAVKATLTNINAGNLLAALPVDLPEQIRDLNGQTSGTVDISGLPKDARGEINLSAAKGVIAGEAFDGLAVKAVFAGSNITLERGDIRVGAGQLSAKGSYDRTSQAFNFELGGKSIPASLLLSFLPKNANIPTISGDVDLTATATGVYERSPTYNFTFSGVAPKVQVNESSLGEVKFKGQTTNQVLIGEVTASLDGHPQLVTASVNFGDDNMPFMVATDFDQSPVGPFLAFIPQVKGMPISGTATGRVQLAGNLSQLDSTGTRAFSTSGLSGTAQFSQLALQIQDTPLSAAEPIVVKFNTREIVFEKAKFAGGGSNMTIAGTKALTDDGSNNLSIDGRVNLNLLNLVSKDIFFSGFADTSVRLSGSNQTSRLSGNANIVNGSVATFLGSDRITVDRLKARMIFTSNQVEVEEASGYLGGGKFTASGGGLLGGNTGPNSSGLAMQAFRFRLDGDNVTVPLPKDFLTTGDAQLTIAGKRDDPASNLQITIGGRVFAKRSLYSKDIDLANLIGARRDPVLSGSSGGTAPRFDLIIEGRDALVVKNNVADLTASVSLVLTGDANDPRISGRITANSGTIFFRKDRYVVQRAVLEFPPETSIDPIINLQAESEIAGYQVFVNLAGPLKDSEQLAATVRSSPALPQADVVSLITTGALSNTTGGIPTLAQSGINTAAEILTDTIINNPARKATDKLFGLNVFEIDPIISGSQLNASARLTVGRQINNNLRVTYSTNLSQDQNQVLALEYRVSNKLSFVAQYEQRALSNVTRNRDNFSFEVRFRRRF